MLKTYIFLCPYCSEKIRRPCEHINSIYCNRNKFYASNGWSLIFNSCLDNKLTDTTTLTNFLNSQNGTSILYVVRKGPLLSHLCYVGVCRSLRRRFDYHNYKKTFSNFDQLEVGVLFNNMSKQCSEFLESLIILSSLLPGNLLNACYEYTNMQSFIGCKNIENFHENVAKYHHYAITLLCKNWQTIEWADFNAICENNYFFSKEVIQILMTIIFNIFLIHTHLMMLNVNWLERRV
ncbi:hypothetical protein ACQ4LE_009174 [Meloidogyne hapla]